MKTGLCLALAIFVVAGRPVAAAEFGAVQTREEADTMPPLALWGDATEVDEPESAYYSIGRTLWHMGRNAALIAKFHDFLREKNVDPPSLLNDQTAPPETLRRILIEPELLPQSGWRPRGDWIVDGPGHRGTGARLPLRIERGGLYRIWIRYMGHKDGTAVTSFTLHRTGQQDQDPGLYEEFHTRVEDSDGPRWHDVMAELAPGDYTIALNHVVRYYQAPQNVPFRAHEVDCVYLTEELWREAPSDGERADLRNRVTPVGAQRDDRPTLTPEQKGLWSLWQVRPSDWETAKANPRLFALSYAFWRREVDTLAKADYTAPPTDPVAGAIADYRDPRRQVIFDPVWNMVGNPYRIRAQREILEKDIDPQAKDAFYDWIFPGQFPVVVGQWERAGVGLTASDSATSGLAAGTYTLPGPGTWHLWVQFKNINYFEYFGVYADTLFGRAARWERTERLYPGGRVAWAKVGAVEVPRLTEEETAAHQASAARGIFVESGKPVFAVTEGGWQPGDGYLESTGETCRLTAKCALNPTNDFHIRARLAITGLAGSGAALVFRESNGVNDNAVQFEGSAKGAAFGTGTTFNAAGLAEGTPFDFELVREGGQLRVLVNQSVVATTPLAEAPGAMFGLRCGKAGVRLYDFSASGGLDDGLAMLRQVKIGLWMDKYINARTFRGVYALLVTDDADYHPEGTLLPKPSPRRFFRQIEASGFTTNKGYVLNVAPGIGLINQTWMPSPEPRDPVIELGMARDTVRSASLMFRSGQYDPVTVKITPGPLKNGWKSYDHAVRWRVVAFAPYGQGRQDWSPFFLLRRPFLTLPPLAPAQAWLTVDSTGIPPGAYQSQVLIECAGGPEGRAFQTRTVTIRVRVADVRVEPKTPILVHGWVTPPAGENYRLDWFKRFNVWMGAFFSKQEMEQYGLKLQVRAQWNANSDQIRAQIADAKKKGLGYDDWMFSVADEPTGQTAKDLATYISIAKLIRAADPNVKITMNPGEAARAATFNILQPYVDLWNPYALHLSYGPSGRAYLKKPWIWYTTPCYGDKSPSMAAELYAQVRSVLRQPGDCRGTAFFSPYSPWRDPWDTAYEHIRDVSVFVLPSRHGPVATPAWEALREAVQHANLARMVRERARPDEFPTKASTTPERSKPDKAPADALGENESAEDLLTEPASTQATPFPKTANAAPTPPPRPDDAQARAVWENGSVEDILAWIESHRTPGSR